MSFALIHDIDLLGFCIEEYIEIVSQKLHLHTGFFGIHRFDPEAFGLDNLNLLVVMNLFIDEEVGKRLGGLLFIN